MVKSRNQSLDVFRAVAMLCFIFEVWMAAIVVPPALQQHVDFSVFYSAGLSLRTHPSALYSLPNCAPYIHPAYEALPFAALSFFGYRAAYAIFVIANLATAWITVKALKLPWEVFAFAPLAITMISGQDSIVFASLLACAWLAAQRERGELTGILLGLAMFRFQDVLPVILLLLVWREWKTVKWFALSAAAMGVLSAALFSPSGYVSVLSNLGHNQAAYVQPIERMINLRGFIAGLGLSHSLFLVVALSFMVLLCCALAGRNWNLENRLALAIAASALVSYHFYIHDLSIAVIPFAAIVKNASSELTRGIMALMLSAAMLAVFNFHIYWIAMASVALIAMLMVSANRTLVLNRSVPYTTTCHDSCY